MRADPVWTIVTMTAFGAISPAPRSIAATHSETITAPIGDHSAGCARLEDRGDAEPPPSPSSQSGLIVNESKYYAIETDLPAERANWVGRLMDATGAEYDRRFKGFRGTIRQKPRVKVFATKETYLAALGRAVNASNAEFTAGVFNPADGTVYTFDAPDLEKTLKHECFHQFVHHVVGGRLPVWTNEGLAEYFEEGRFDERTGKLTLGAMPAYRVRLLQAMKARNELLPVSYILKMSSAQWHENMSTPVGPLQYAQAWALCHFLVHAEGGKYASYFDKYLRELDKGLDGDTAFRKVFGADLQPLEVKYAQYIDSLRGE